MDTRVCPNCAHENLPRAVFCFRCGTYLGDPPGTPGTQRNRRGIKDAMPFAHGREERLEPGLSADSGASDAQLPAPIDGTAITCLRCGTRNPPQDNYCMGCGVALAVPDENPAHDPVPRAAALSDVGQARENNEDRVGLWGLLGVVLAVVADGMGGAVAGEEASRLVMEAIQADFLGEARGSQNLRALSEEEIAEKLRGAVRLANRTVVQRAGEHPDLHGMGTTLTLALVRGRRVTVAHVGDSRAYLVTGTGGINQITDDHSFVEALVASGHITSEQAAAHPMRNVLYRALGQTDDLQADLYGRRVDPGDTLILCSDGLTRDVTPEDLAAIATRHDDPADVARELIQLANERGGEDNISAVVIRMAPAEDVELGAPPESLLYDDTEIGLFRAPFEDEDEDMGRETIELSALEDVEEDESVEDDPDRPSSPEVK